MINFVYPFQTGPWTYTIERFRNPQPHFVQVMASPKLPTVPVVRTKFWTNLNFDYVPQTEIRKKRNLEKDMEGAENQEWTSQTVFPNFVNHPIGRSYESEPLGQDSDTISKTTRSFTDFVNSKIEEDPLNDKLGEYKRSSAYRLTLDDLRKNQELSRSRNSLSRSAITKPVVLYVEVKSGMWPVRGARVEVTITKRTMNDTNRYKERFELLDTGSGGKRQQIPKAPTKQQLKIRWIHNYKTFRS